MPFLIAIAGPSCAGKSELSSRLSKRLDAPILHLDSYYRDLSHMPLDARGLANFDEPGSLDEPLLLAHIQALARGQAVDKPVYDFARHARAAAVQRLAPSAVMIVEGLFALHWPELRALYGASIYIGARDEVCFERRKQRDIRERGRTPECVREQYEATVRPMAERYVTPTSRFAGLVLDGEAPLSVSERQALHYLNSAMAGAPASNQAWQERQVEQSTSLSERAEASAPK
ncbi:MAG: AAA family ATPase [Bryobacteraceae bacterium]|nr:AAA family ATPase [Bryobacteraceae bacterium]